MKRVVLLALVALALPAAAAAGVAQGERLYGRFCVSCHGPNGAGRLAAPSGAGPARDQTVQLGSGPSLRGVGALAADFYLRTGYMPLLSPHDQPWRSRVRFTDGEIRALVAYVASLGGPPIPHPHPERGNVAQGRALFADNCAACHQSVAVGGMMPGARVPTLARATPTEIAEAVRIGPYVMPKFGADQLSDRDLASIARYVEYAKNPRDEGGWGMFDIGPVPEGMATWFVGALALVLLIRVLGKRAGE
jgi:ubiquinol-cytochrome c reductase cytochrome c subunit